MNDDKIDEIWMRCAKVYVFDQLPEIRRFARLIEAHALDYASGRVQRAHAHLRMKSKDVRAAANRVSGAS